MMDWDKLRIFHAAADAGSFTHAGERLHMSQSAVSRQVSGLERDLGVSLFHRHARGLVLTEQGELLYRTAHDVLNKLQSVETRLADTKEKPSGRLRVNTVVGLGSSWLTPRIGEFIELYPDIQLELILSDDERDIAMREADAAIWLREPSQNDLIRRPLFGVRLHAYASPRYLREHGTPTKVSDLDTHRILTFGGSTPAQLSRVNWLETVGRDNDRPRTPALRVNSIYGLKQAVKRDIGIAIIPDYMVDSQSDIVRILEDAELPHFQTYFVYPEELRNSKRVNVFRDFLLSKARAWKF